MAKRSEPDLILLAFELVAERGWAGFSPAGLARRAGLSLAQVYAELPDRAASFVSAAGWTRRCWICRWPSWTR